MIGIDLGTTNSLVSILRDGQPCCLVNELGETLTPSAIAYAEDGTLLVGRAARDRLILAPQSGRAFFKRDMGSDAVYSIRGQKWTPIECSARILQEMKRVAELALGTAVQEAVITVPAYFHEPQRQATVAAASLAGLKVARLLNEPTAAALAYGFRQPGDDSTLLVFDLGGGTFDVTLLEVFDGVVEVKASGGESRLGGEDFTDALAAWIRRESGWVPAAAETGLWRQEIEMLKRSLTEQERADFCWKGQKMPLSREDLKAATLELSARLWPVVRRCLRDAGITPQHLTDVLLVGGASRMPLIATGIQEMLGKQPQARLDPDRVVALGAAVQQGLCTRDAAVQDLVLTDVCPHTLGIAVAKNHGKSDMPDSGYFEPLIDRNTPVPVSRSKLFFTLHPKQDQILVEIFQGESRRVEENQKLGFLNVKEMRHQEGQAHPGELEVRFSYDMNSLLEVEVTRRSDGSKVSKVFEQRPGMLSAGQIRDALERLAPLKTHPRDLPPNRALLERANRLYEDLTGSLRETLDGLIDEFEAALNQTDSEHIRRCTRELNDFMRPYFSHEEEPPSL